MSILKATSWQTIAGVQGPLLASNGVMVTKLPAVSRVYSVNVSTTGAIVIVGFGNTAIDTIGSSTFGSYAIRPQLSGNYLVVADLNFSGTSPAAWTPVMRLRKNGSDTYTISSLINYSGGHSGQQNLSRIVTANGTTDYFEIAWSHNNGTNYTVNGGGFTLIRVGDL
jgi:hypothetical protein